MDFGILFIVVSALVFLFALIHLIKYGNEPSEHPILDKVHDFFFNLPDLNSYSSKSGSTYRSISSTKTSPSKPERMRHLKEPDD